MFGDGMVKYTNTDQLSFDTFKTPFQFGLDSHNRWIRLSGQIPWDDLSKIYIEQLHKDHGRPAISPRVVIGALIIKHKKSLSDEATIEEIQENPYLQYFLGNEEFSHKRVFDPSLFVTLRKRIGEGEFSKMNQVFIDKIDALEKSTKKRVSKTKTGEQQNQDQSTTGSSDDAKPQNEGNLILDASVAPQDIRYPTDLELLNEAREHTERIIDILYEPSPDKRKPRTYRRNARKAYLAMAHKRRKSKQSIRKAIRKQLNYVRRNINTINKLLGDEMGNPLPLSFRDLRLFRIVQELYRQQQQMYDERSHQIVDRIVSISQPYVRPIVRGKSGKTVEFGAKLSVSLVKGFAFLDHLSWDAFNESTDLICQVEQYRTRFGFYPEVVITDKIYGTRENRNYLKSKGIRYSGKALGRPPKLTDETIKAERAKRKQRKKESRLRNQIEGKFGEGKRKYDLDCVKTKTMQTSGSWIAAIFFVMNLAHWMRLDFFAPFLKQVIIGLWVVSKYVKELSLVKTGNSYVQFQK